MDKRSVEFLIQRIHEHRGLTKSMRSNLRAHPQMVQMVECAVCYLAETNGHMTRMQLWRELLVTNGEWVDEVPSFAPNLSNQDRPDHVRYLREISFERVPKRQFQFPIFNGAMTIAKHVGLISGWGRIGLSPEIREMITAGIVFDVAD